MREKLIELLNEAEEHSTDVCCFNSTCEDCPGRKYGNKCRDYLKANHLIANGVTVQDNTEISDEFLKMLKTAPVTILQEEPTIETVQEWISVKDRLPEKDGEYLVRFDNKVIHNAEYESKCGSFGYWLAIMWDEDADWFPYVGVTHWMPLPPAPEVLK